MTTNQKLLKTKKALNATEASAKIIIDGLCLGYLKKIRKDLKQAAKKLESVGAIKIITCELAEHPRQRRLINNVIARINAKLKRNVVEIHHLRNVGKEDTMMYYYLIDQKQCYVIKPICSEGGKNITEEKVLLDAQTLRSYNALFDSIWQITPPFLGSY